MCGRGFERDIIIAIICLSRVVGGLAHWRETLSKLSVLLKT